ncbi:hypothetical protein O181_003819 [Austropuccinia psidii MF-1]|uniref:Uncharacterized protein n=1 Tax=Austropuccinia psidii MF-1 TaxID=1389203 RepID=A0A9Q3BF26_9BASI|nr:hypothetical protein [Austropuccinia psidii MF-1]
MLLNGKKFKRATHLPLSTDFPSHRSRHCFLPSRRRHIIRARWLCRGTCVDLRITLSTSLVLCVSIVDDLVIGGPIVHTRLVWRIHDQGSPLPTPFRSTRPATPDRRLQQGSGAQYQREWVSQVHFVEHGASDKVLIDTGASIHLSGAVGFASCMRTVSPFCIFFANSNSSILITQMTSLRLPVHNGTVIIWDVAYSDKITGTILSVGHLCTLGVVPVFDDMALSL